MGLKNGGNDGNKQANSIEMQPVTMTVVITEAPHSEVLQEPKNVYCIA